MEYYSFKGFISFESRKDAYNEIMAALKDGGIRNIGVHGMGGCGKTTLVKEVGKEVEKLRLFEKVLIVVVSNPPDIRKIQAGIASSLDFKFETEENEPERARRLSMAIKNRGKILVILDDVWKKLNFEDIGIPNDCYILLTTRESSVCSAMKCQKVILLKVLDDMESWILFQKHAGISDDKLVTFEDVGKKIATECKGLPVAIAAVASSLKDKGLVHWEVALDKLRDSTQGDIEPALEDIYECLRLSYDNLKGEGVRSLFLLCSFYPKDFEILVERLTRYAMGLGLFRKIQSNEKARKEVKVAIDKLINSYLLLGGDTKNTIKMHDLIHDFALHIAKTENKTIMMIERSKQELEKHLISNNSQIRYLFWDVDKFPYQINCPKVEFLAINSYIKNQVEVPNECFNQMNELRVLTLLEQFFESQILQLSKSIQSLTNLRYLHLSGWQLGDISFVSSLVKIETLMLYNCSFHELPNGVANLKNLRLLDMLGCKIERNPYEVIKICSQLEELYFVRNEYPNRGANGENRFFGKSGVTPEFKLQRFHIEIGSSFIGFDVEDYSITRYLSINDHDVEVGEYDALIRKAEVLCLGVIQRGCKSIIPTFVQKIGEGMTELTRLMVNDIDEVECVVDMTKYSFNQIGTVFSNLTYLGISEMQHLETLFLGQPHHGLFQKLENLHISGCNKLKHIIANASEIISDGDNPRICNSVFPKLKRIYIFGCEQLQYLMPVSFANGLLQLESVLLQSLPNIKSMCPENHYPIWPSLNSLQLAGCPQLKTMPDDLEFRNHDHTFAKNGIVFGNLTRLILFELNCFELFVSPHHLSGFQKLEEIFINSCNQLKHLIANDAKISSDGNNLRSNESIFPKLKLIDISSCQQLEYLMPVAYAKSLQQLEKVNIIRASELKYVFGQSNYKSEDQLCSLIKLGALNRLTLKRLPNIIGIFPENYYPIWPSLDTLFLIRCPRLNLIPIKNCIVGFEPREQHHTITKEFGAAMISNVQNLKSLSVSNNDVEGIFHLQELPTYGQVIASLTILVLYDLSELKYIWSGPKQSLSLQNLQILKIRSCGQLKFVFSASILRSLNQLKMLEITKCEELQQIIEMDEENDDQLSLPQLNTLVVQRCKKLKCVFSFPTSIELPKLKFLGIKEASELEKVIEHQKCDIKEQAQVKFPELEHVVLVQLPNLREVYQEIELETVKYQVVHHCPKLSLMSNATLENLKEIYEDLYRDNKIEWDIYETIDAILEKLPDVDYTVEIPDENSGEEIPYENSVSEVTSYNPTALDNSDFEIPEA